MNNEHKQIISNTFTISDIMTNGKNILYEHINKPNIKKILEILERDKILIGRPILLFADDENTIPLHYAIHAKNIAILKLILSYSSIDDLMFENNDGNNSLHIAVKNEDYEIMILVLKKFTELQLNISKTNYSGDNALHISCKNQNVDISKELLLSGINVNKKNITHDYIPITYVTNIELLKLLISFGSNINDQDYYGNTILHHSIINKNYDICNYLLELPEINVNKFNIYLELPIHLYIKHADIRVNELSKLIKLSLMNFQNNKGETPFLLLVKHNLWKEYANEIELKKIDILSRTKQKNTSIDYVSTNDIESFKIMITKSYLNGLKSDSKIFRNEWENICNSSNNSVNNISILQKLTRQTSNDSKKLCFNIVYDHITNLIENKNKIVDLYHKSFPVPTHKSYLNIQVDNNSEFCTFIGLKIDILFGLIYLISLRSNITSPINSELVSINNNELTFEIIWKNNNLIINKLFTALLVEKKKSSSRFIVMPLGIEILENAHSNYLIYDNKLNEIERFEPYGCESPQGFNYNSELLDKRLEKYFKHFIPGIKYFKPNTFMNKICFQHLDAVEYEMKQYGDPGGFCAVWSIWYVDMRTKYYDIERSKLIEKLIKNISYRHYSFKQLIRAYSEKIVSIRNKFLKIGGISINEWINERFDDSQINEVIKSVKKYVDMIMTQKNE